MIQNEDDEEIDDEEVKEELSFKDIKKLSGTFWILLLISTLCLSLYIPFLDNANQFCQQRFNYSPILAGRAIIITYLTPTILSPIIGQLVDRIGLRRRWLLGTACLFILTHTLFAVIPTPKDGEPQFYGLIPLCLLGVSYTFYSCVAIPSVQYVVEQRIMGTAFGVLCLMESVGQCVFPLVAAIIYETHDNYKQVALFYTGVSTLTLFFGVSLYFVDKKGSEILDAKNPTELFEKKSNLSDSDDDDMELPDQNTTANSQIEQVPKEKKLSFKLNGQSEIPVFEVQR